MKILREDEKDVLQFANAHPLASIGRLFTAARSRIAEDALSRAVDEGIRQISETRKRGAAEMAQSLGESPTVFVIDDDENLRASIASLLKSEGLRAETFASVEEFLSRERSDGPGCLVIDVKLPSTTGFAAHRQLSDAGLQFPTIFISAYDDKATIARSMKSGAVAFLRKPFKPQDFLNAIQEALNRHRIMRGP
jgi:CheY-like chemotaxis protein